MGTSIQTCCRGLTLKAIIADSETIDYYEKSFETYDSKTFHLDLSPQWDFFANTVRPGGKILDIGCGTGRDIIHFKNLGFSVDGLEPSKNMASIASKRTHANIFNIPVESLDIVEHYDGIWACASLLHVKKESFPYVISAILRALKYDGYLYISLKKGDEQIRLEDGRLFSLFTEEKISIIFENLPGASIIKSWSTTDSAGRGDVVWLNMMIKKEQPF